MRHPRFGTALVPLLTLAVACGSTQVAELPTPATTTAPAPTTTTGPATTSPPATTAAPATTAVPTTSTGVPPATVAPTTTTAAPAATTAAVSTTAVPATVTSQPPPARQAPEPFLGAFMPALEVPGEHSLAYPQSLIDIGANAVLFGLIVP
ncbi:MAG: hypothetical protein QF523_03540, partial [Acidimicrobiales bacterium]|nr:hypothetical protein [Acidimicrobiales bacterium]